MRPPFFPLRSAPTRYYPTGLDQRISLAGTERRASAFVWLLPTVLPYRNGRSAIPILDGAITFLLLFCFLKHSGFVRQATRAAAPSGSSIVETGQHTFGLSAFVTVNSVHRLNLQPDFNNRPHVTWGDGCHLRPEVASGSRPLIAVANTPFK